MCDCVLVSAKSSRSIYNIPRFLFYVHMSLVSTLVSPCTCIGESSNLVSMYDILNGIKYNA